MKAKCDFCKTEYVLNKIPAVPVKCAICGHVWMIKTPCKKNQFFVFFAALCALLSAIVFFVVIMAHHQGDVDSKSPLVASIVKTELAPDGNNINHFIVSGIIENKTDELYGAPNVIIMTYDENNKQVNAPEQFNPPVTFLDAGARVGFVYTLRAPSIGVKKIVVKLKDFAK